MAAQTYGKSMDRLTARLHQASAVVSALQVQYDYQKAGEKVHHLTPVTMENALWALSEMIDEAYEAARMVDLHGQPKKGVA